MQRINPYLQLLILIVIIAVLHIVGLKFYLYWQLVWYDRIIHILGGAWIAIIALQVTKASSPEIPARRLFIISLCAALFVGLVWEVFEIVIGFANPASRGYGIDTTTDLIFDVIGGGLGYLYAIKFGNTAKPTA